MNDWAKFLAGAAVIVALCVAVAIGLPHIISALYDTLGWH